MDNMKFISKYPHKMIFSINISYLLVVLAVVSVFAVCLFNIVETSFCENCLVGEITTSGFCDFSEHRLILHPEHTGSIHKHPDFQNQSPSVSSDPFSVKNQSDFCHSVLYYFHIWSPWNLKLSILMVDGVSKNTQDDSWRL